MEFSCNKRGEILAIGIELSGSYRKLKQMGELWQTFKERVEEIPNILNLERAIGVVHGREKNFTYFAAIEVENLGDVPSGMIPIIIPARTYAVFTHKGKQEKFNETVVAAKNLLTQSSYKIDHNAFWLEIYDDHRFQPNSTNSECDVCFPLVY